MERDTFGGSEHPVTGEVQASFRFLHGVGRAWRRCEKRCPQKPFCVLRGCDLGKHTQSLMLTSHSPSNTSPLSSESRVKTLSPGMSSVPPALGSKWGRVLRTPRSLPCTHWPRVQPQSLLLHGAFQSSPTAVLFPLQITTLVFVGLIPP